MTAQEWLDELGRLRKAATPGPWEAWRYNAGFVRISTCPLDPDDDEVIKVADSPDITVSDAAYIVAGVQRRADVGGDAQNCRESY